jgi:hypothetical protein
MTRMILISVPQLHSPNTPLYPYKKRLNDFRNSTPQSSLTGPLVNSETTVTKLQVDVGRMASTTVRVPPERADCPAIGCRLFSIGADPHGRNTGKP